jgi:hypothetical protein
MVIDPVNDEKNGIRHGIRYSDGDGSVPLLSLGYVCVDAWKRDGSGLNPSKSKVFTREYLHQSQFSADDPMRGGPLASDHVGILGNVDMMEDIIKVVTDFQAKEVTQDRIVSDIAQIAAHVNAHRLGGLSRQHSLWINRHMATLFSSIRSAVRQVTPHVVTPRIRMWSWRKGNDEIARLGR